MWKKVRKSCLETVTRGQNLTSIFCAQGGDRPRDKSGRGVLDFCAGRDIVSVTIGNGSRGEAWLGGAQ